MVSSLERSRVVTHAASTVLHCLCARALCQFHATENRLVRRGCEMSRL